MAYIRIAALILACLIIQPVIAAPANIAASDQLWARISSSFSKIPVGVQLSEVEIPLAEIRYSSCRDKGPCWVETADRVRHIFNGEEQRLSEKQIRNLRPYSLSVEAINALDLEQARKKIDVVNKILLFLGEEKYECIKVSDWQGYLATVYPEESLCTWEIPGGEVSAKFLDLGTNGVLLDELAFRRSAK